MPFGIPGHFSLPSRDGQVGRLAFLSGGRHVQCLLISRYRIRVNLPKSGANRTSLRIRAGTTAACSWLAAYKAALGAYGLTIRGLIVSPGTTLPAQVCISRTQNHENHWTDEGRSYYAKVRRSRRIREQYLGAPGSQHLELNRQPTISIKRISKHVPTQPSAERVQHVSVLQPQSCSQHIQYEFPGNLHDTFCSGVNHPDKLRDLLGQPTRRQQAVPTGPDGLCTWCSGTFIHLR